MSPTHMHAWYFPKLSSQVLHFKCTSSAQMCTCSTHLVEYASDVWTVRYSTMHFILQKLCLCTKYWETALVALVTAGQKTLLDCCPHSSGLPTPVSCPWWMGSWWHTLQRLFMLAPAANLYVHADRSPSVRIKLAVYNPVLQEPDTQRQPVSKLLSESQKICSVGGVFSVQSTELPPDSSLWERSRPKRTLIQ